MDSGGIEFSLRGIGVELRERLLSVPIYQRPYAWTIDELTEYWTDLRAAFSEKSVPYFLGTVVLTRQGQPDRDTIIDGQQRLATTAILLAAIREEFRSRGDATRAGIIHRKFLATADLDSGGDISRLSLNSEDAPFFDGRIVAGTATPKATRSSHVLIQEALAYFREQVAKVADDAGGEWDARLKQWVAFLQDEVVVLVLRVKTDSDAYLIFETLNDRGADLTIADLLKNYLFGHAEAKLDTVRDTWMLVLGALEVTAENKLFKTFLRHYWSSRLGAVRERLLYKSIKEQVVSPPQVVQFVGDLREAAVVYNAILNSEHEYWEPFGTSVRKNVETLVRLGLEQNRPLLLAVLQHFEPKEVKKLLRHLVSWSVRGLIVGGIGGGTTEAAYCGAAAKVRKGEIKNSAQVLTELRTIIPTDDEFKAAFTVARVSKASLARYFLIALEMTEKGEPEPELVPNEDEEKVNLEHVLPKNATDKDWGKHFKTADDRKDFAFRLGNLALLQKGPNGRIGNKPFSVKKPILSKSAFVLTKETAKVPEWTMDAIRARQERLAVLALKAWPRG